MDLDFALKWVTGRNLAVLGGLAVLLWAGDHLQQYPRGLYERWRYPPQAGKSPRAAAIEQELDRKESLRLKVLHRQVSAEISQARAKGLPVAGLQRMADAALSLNAPSYRLEAARKLNEVRLRVPQADRVRPLGPDDERFDIPPDVRGKARARR